MGSHRRPDPGRLEVETDGELTQRLGPPAVDATVHSQLQQPQRADPDRHHPAGEIAPIELEQLQWHSQAADHRLHLLHGRPALLAPGGRSRAAGRSSGELGHRKRCLRGFCAFLEQPFVKHAFTMPKVGMGHPTIGHPQPRISPPTPPSPPPPTAGGFKTHTSLFSAQS